MTLRRQILWATGLVFLVLVLGLVLLGLANSREYIEQQLASHAQDAASVLSLPVSQALAAQDQAQAEALIAAVFDRGDYRQIMVLGADGEQVIKRELPLDVSGVPSWFSNLFEFEAPAGEAFLTAGLRQLGKIEVLSQPVFAYRQAWAMLAGMLVWALLIFGLAALLLVLLLRVLFQPLDRVSRAASAIVNRQFEQITPLPRVHELKGVVSALNLMISSVKRFLDEEEARSASFRREAYSDAVSGLQNRRAFDLLMNQRLGGPDREQDGALLMVGLDGLKEFNTQLGYPAGDQLLRQLAEILLEVAGQQAELVSRIGGETFALVLFDCNENEVEILMAQLRDRLCQVLAPHTDGMTLSLAVGGALFRADESFGQVMARCDLALEMAAHERHGGIVLNRPQKGEFDQLGSQGWRQLIFTALQERRWILHNQPVVDLHSGKVVHKEIMARLLDHDGRLIPASQFLPMAARHGLMPDIDRVLIDLVLARVAQSKNTSYAINISRQTIESKSFVYAQLMQKLKSRPCHLLSFEISEYSFMRNIGAARALFDSLRKAGCKVGIDRFGVDVSSMSLLRSYPPDYIKLDGGLVEEMVDHADSAELVRMMVRLADSLNVAVYAQGVQKPEVAKMLQDCGVKAGQGYHYGQPALF